MHSLSLKLAVHFAIKTRRPMADCVYLAWEIPEGQQKTIGTLTFLIMLGPQTSRIHLLVDVGIMMNITMLVLEIARGYDLN